MTDIERQILENQYVILLTLSTIAQVVSNNSLPTVEKAIQDYLKDTLELLRETKED